MIYENIPVFSQNSDWPFNSCHKHTSTLRWHFCSTFIEVFNHISEVFKDLRPSQATEYTQTLGS